MQRRVVIAAAIVCVSAIVWGVFIRNGVHVGWGLAGVLLLGWIAHRISASRTTVSPHVQFVIDGRGVRCNDQSVEWAELICIRIVTTNEGPYFEDLFWVFEAAQDGSCVVPGSHVTGALFDWLGKLPSVDFSAVIQAQGSTECAQFLVWTGERGTALPHAGAA